MVSGAPPADSDDVLARFSEPVRAWFRAAFGGPTHAQRLGLKPIAEGRSTLLLAPTGSGKTLAAFLSAIERVMFGAQGPGLKVVYVSPLKALAVDIEKNLRAPIAGIADEARARGAKFHLPTVFVRSGDTKPKERAGFARAGSDVLITTPESLYLLLTSEASRHFRSVETVIVDEVHVLAGTKRGSHLWLSLERLEALRASDLPPLVRVGLTATVRPLDAVARALGGYSGPGEPRPVEVVDAGSRRAVELTIDVPVEDLRAVSGRAKDAGPGALDPSKSIWPSIYPRLVELIRAHTTTLVFVNNRRLAERLANAINELAGEELALAHHGSVAHDRRVEIEGRLKAGAVRAIVATSSLELGIDMGSIDLVVQIEAPPSASAGMQRVGRAGHRATAISKGVVIPKFRADLLACVATALAMREGAVETTSVPENALDVLAQQIVAIVSMAPIGEAELFALVRRAAPYAALPQPAYEGVLDMLSGRYPSEELSELRPRLTWDRATGRLTPRAGAKSVAILSGGTIPDRGLFGVFLDTPDRRPVRIGELDEEMVFESRVGEVFLLGASSWRITDITFDRVLAVPAPGEPGKMPFWRGDRAGRPAELGLRIGALARRVAAVPEAQAAAELVRDGLVDERGARNLVTYIHEQRRATGEVPSDEVVVIERFVDELGDQRVCVLSALGARVLAPWAMAVQAQLESERGLEIDAIWSDDGVVFRVPDAEAAPPLSDYVPPRRELEAVIARALSDSALFATRFRENAARALLLPRRSPLKRSPLWAQRRRAADLLRVASRFEDFPIVLETFRECLREALDLGALGALLEQIEDGRVRVVRVESKTPSPFASSLMFSYTASFMYEGDAPIAERRAQALSLDPERLRELLGEVELSDLLDDEVIREAGAHAGHARPVIAHADHLHDMCLALGDLNAAEIDARLVPGVDAAPLVLELVSAGRAVWLDLAGERRLVAVEEVARYRDALGAALPSGIPKALLAPVAEALVGLAGRYARTHGPFAPEALARRYALGLAEVHAALAALVRAGRLARGSFTKAGHADELVDPEILRVIKRRSLARLRRAVEPVSGEAFARFTLAHHEIGLERRGPDAVLAVVERLDGVALPISVWFDDVFSARVRGFAPSLLDELCSSGELVWRGVEPMGPSDARVCFHTTERATLLGPASRTPEHPLASRVLEVLELRGAIFFSDLAARVGGFSGDVLEALWDLVFAGLVTNDTTAPLRSRYAVGGADASRRHPSRRAPRRELAPGSEGRWSLLTARDPASSPTEQAASVASAVLDRLGVVTREGVSAEGQSGGFSAVYPVLRAMEEAGKLRRGYFVEGLGAAQFARPGVDERLRALRDPPENIERAVVLAAQDPANLYGAVLPWPVAREDAAEGGRLARVAGAHVVLVDGRLAAYLGRGAQTMRLFFAADDEGSAALSQAVARALATFMDQTGRKVLIIQRIDGQDAARSPLAPGLREAGFTPTDGGLMRRREGSFARR
ncbi:MAG: DEAD/DEAH box helicase [Polyangiaceae bacterium]|jgi:ATP-dependent Lhr-like helicase|nr:DEAD/DEAH box helicase [Polyangiaceae bacterium]